LQLRELRYAHPSAARPLAPFSRRSLAIGILAESPGYVSTVLLINPATINKISEEIPGLAFLASAPKRTARTRVWLCPRLPPNP
jgi:hypothetical protein